MTRNEMTNRQSELSGLESGTPQGQGFLLKEIAIALFEIAKHLGLVVEALDRQAHAR